MAIESLASASLGERRTGEKTRVEARGKFLFVNGEKLYVRGVTYGAFRPDPEGREYYDLDAIERDFAQMAASGINCVRIPHTMPPRSLLDKAAAHGLRVMVGLSGEQYVGFLVDGHSAGDIEATVRARVATSAGHPALLCYAIGNEISAPIVRWLGRRRVEKYLERLCRVIKAADPGAIVTYVNYPTTEYLQLPFLDVVSFNVYLESQQPFEAYIARLQNIAGDRPLMLTELGLDSLRNGDDGQARSLDWQVRTAFAAGCAGAFVFAWTDEWYREGAGVDDWRFGLTDESRRPKPSLAAVQQAFKDVPFPATFEWPRISVIVCTYNGQRTIRDCLDGLGKLQYPNFNVIVVDDGSVDETAAIAEGYGFRVISTENRGLSSARNMGLAVATGDIVAYIDDDAWPDPHWLAYIAAAFTNPVWAAVGGPNIAPPGEGVTAAAVARAPGGPIHVLFSDREAEHIPGCNMAFRKSALEAIGGFDPLFRTAGDDVDVCWRLHERGLTIGFSPAAMVWHRRRNSVRTYWRQQLGYGRAEALLENKWPEKYNSFGQARWQGRLYSGLVPKSGRGSRIYHGVWGSAGYQSLYQPLPGLLSSLPTMPEWHLGILALAAISALGALWSPLLLALPLLALGLLFPMLRAALAAALVPLNPEPGTRLQRLWLLILVAFLHLVQPLARLSGRFKGGLVPWRRRGARRFTFPRANAVALWTEDQRAPNDRLHSVEASLREQGAVFNRGGLHDRWDLQVRGGMLGSVRALMAVEEHGSGAQLVRWRCSPLPSLIGVALAIIFAFLSAGAAVDGALSAAVILASVPVFTVVQTVRDSGYAMGTALRAFHQANEGRKVGER